MTALVAVAALLGATGCSHSRSTKLSFESAPRPVLSKLGLANSRDASLALSSSGTLSMLVAYSDEGGNHVGFAMSHNGGDTFMPIVTVSGATAKVSSHGENAPRLISTPTVTYALWEQRSDKGNSEIVMGRSLDYGHSFLKPVVVTGDESSAFHGFSSLGVSPAGDVYVVWLDGRDPVGKGDTFALYIARSTDQGASFGKPHRVALSACPCCRPAINFTSNGVVLIAWRKVYGDNIRDLAFSVSHDAGETFAPEVRVADDGWHLNGCPDSGPSLAVNGSRIYIAWLTEGREQKARVQLSWSDDQGKSFHATVRASRDVLDPNHAVLRTSEDGRVMLAFQGREQNAQQGWAQLRVFLSDVHGDEIGPPEPVPTEGSSASYPALGLGTAGRVFLAWTSTSDQSSNVQLLRTRAQ
jgi:hypothetical protein